MSEKTFVFVKVNCEQCRGTGMTGEGVISKGIASPEGSDVQVCKVCEGRGFDVILKTDKAVN
jgi:hypothetical protein